MTAHEAVKDLEHANVACFFKTCIIYSAMGRSSCHRVRLCQYSCLFLFDRQVTNMSAQPLRMKRILLIIALLGGLSKANAQLEYIHSAGVGYYHSYLDKVWRHSILAKTEFPPDGMERNPVSWIPAFLGYYVERGTYAEEAYFTTLFPVTINWNMKMVTLFFATEQSGWYMGAGLPFMKAGAPTVIMVHMLPGVFVLMAKLRLTLTPDT